MSTFPQRRQPWIQSLVAMLIGMGFFFLDEVYQHHATGEPFLESWTEWLELGLMSPGLGFAAWYLFSYRWLREDILHQEIERQRDERFLVLGRLAGSMAHEIRNPLHNAHLIVEALEITPPDDRNHRDLARRLRENLGRIDSAVDLIYQLVRRRGDPARETIDLAHLLRQAARDLPTEQAAQLRFDLPPTFPIATAPDRLRIIIGNLLRNGLDAAGAEQVDLILSGDPTHWQLQVRNPGTAPPWLIDASQPVPSGGGGLGLGLAISRQLADQLALDLSFHQLGTIVVARLFVRKEP